MYELPALITVFSLLFYCKLGFDVGKARGKYDVKAPATSGHEMFERIYRVQMNTLEQLVYFLPSLWLFTIYLNAPMAAAGLGVVWLVGRVIFARAYITDPSKRSAGFATSFFSASILLLGGLVGIIMHLAA
jgi:glutathione S-transferase